MSEQQTKTLRGFRFEGAPFEWVLSPQEPKVATLQQLLQKFYDEFDPSEPDTYKPLGLVRNPMDVELQPYFGNNEVIAIPYRKRFLIIVEEQFREPFGPHPARLLYKCWQTDEMIWVAILQISEFFFSDEKMLLALTLGIQESNFFQSPKTASTIIIL